MLQGHETTKGKRRSPSKRTRDGESEPTNSTSGEFQFRLKHNNPMTGRPSATGIVIIATSVFSGKRYRPIASSDAWSSTSCPKAFSVFATTDSMPMSAMPPSGKSSPPGCQPIAPQIRADFASYPENGLPICSKRVSGKIPSSVPVVAHG